MKSCGKIQFLKKNEHKENINIKNEKLRRNAIYLKKMSTATGGTKSKILDTKIGDDVGAQILWVYRSRSRGISHQDEECFYNHCTQQLHHIFISIYQIRLPAGTKIESNISKNL